MNRSAHVTLRIAALAVIAVEALLPRTAATSRDTVRSVAPSAVTAPAPVAAPGPIAAR